MTSKTSFIAQEGPANALALNKDNSQVVIAGRNGILDYILWLFRRAFANVQCYVFSSSIQNFHVAGGQIRGGLQFAGGEEFKFELFVQ